VVDDRSTDYTDTWLAEEQAKDSRVRHVRIDKTPAHFTAKKYAITMGIKHAKHDALVLTDADCVPDSEQWLSQIAAPLANGKKISLGYSPMYAKAGLLNSLIRFETVLTALQYLGAALGGRPYMGVGRNMAYSKALFLEKKGFLSHRNVMGGDDDLFVNRNATKDNTQIVIGAETLVWTEPKESWGEWWTQKRRHMAAGKYYRWSTRLGLGLFMLSQWMFWITFGLLLGLGIEPYWVFGCLILKFAVLFGVVCSASKKLGDPFCPWYLPFLEFLLMLYQTGVGVSVLFSKPSSWK
jgi:cellulose synthase/poly-beta-1,6-N-acetylglucosamine synthase-like glycosyltransferase